MIVDLDALRGSRSTGRVHRHQNSARASGLTWDWYILKFVHVKSDGDLGTGVCRTGLMMIRSGIRLGGPSHWLLIEDAVPCYTGRRAFG